MSLRSTQTNEGPKAPSTRGDGERTRLRVELATTDVDEILAFAAMTGCRIERLLGPDRLVVSHAGEGDPVRDHELVQAVEPLPHPS
ncbi:hypothetical protein JCM17823_08510 [Halorubrum gandharaense]